MVKRLSFCSNRYVKLGIGLLGLFMPMANFAQDTPAIPTEVITGVFLGETPPLRDLPVLTDAEKQKMHEKAQKKLLNPKIVNRSYPFADIALPKGPDPVWQQMMGNNRETRAPLQSYEGAETASSFPTDANGTIGPNHYMQTINTVYTIYDRAGVIVAGPTALNNLFYNLPGAETNDGDPIVLYDEQADRWLLAEFSWTGANDYMLIAVSTTNDPTGTWYKYSFDVADKPDYEKFGIWRDGYYMGTNNSNGNDIYVFDRSQMLLGQTAQMVGFDNSWRPTTWDGFLCVPPLDNDGEFAPEGEPGLFIAFNDDGIGGGTDELWIYELDVDWNNLGASTFNRVQQLPVAAFDSNFGNDLTNIRQPGTGVPELDAVPQVIMNPPQYRNFGSYETIVCCHTVDVDNTDHAGIRWYELRRVSSGNWTIRQQGTYAPDAHSRWMGSIMLNGSNEIGLGYSISSSTIYPGIRYCGQSSTAYASANSTLDVAEEIILTGTYSQSSLARWGDYSGLQVDVADGETFWYTNQYIGTSNIRKTKIASFQIGSVILTANFAVSNPNPSLYSVITLTDVSYGSPTSWNWSISPSTLNYIAGTSSASQHPQVQFTEAGTYTVTLTITNGSINDSETKTNYITVTDCGYTSLLPFTEDFSEQVMPPCWKTSDNAGNGHTWLFNNPASRVINTITGSNGVAILDSDYYGFSYHQNADLISPPFNFSDYSTVTISFGQYFRIYGTGPPYSAYGRLYYSLNDGLSWTLVATWAGTNNGNTWSQTLAPIAGQSKVRFKWNYTGAGYYWAIDDISITGTGPNTWTGTTSTAWETTTNWSSGTAPTSTSKVIIPATATNWPTLSGDFTLGTTCDKITLYGASQMTVNGNVILTSGKTMAISGNATVNLTGHWVNGGGLFLPGKSTLTFTGSTPSFIRPATTSTSGITNYLRSTFPVGMTALTSPVNSGPTGNDEGTTVTNFGFTFNYLGTNYTIVRICTNGWMILLDGTSTLTSNANVRLFNTNTPNITLAPWWDDLNADGSTIISYKTEGTSPYRVLTVEWKNILTYSSNATERINFQAKLYETTNVIEFHYGTITAGTNNASESASIGIENAIGGSGNFIEATTGSTTTGVTNLTSTSNWPTVNYRFSPTPGTMSFHNITASKSSTYLDLLANNQVNGALTISTGTVSGPTASVSTLQMKGNFTNNGIYTPGSGTLILNGSSVQTIGGSTSTSFNKLTLSNPAGFTLANNETVAGTLTMTEGSVDCGAYTFQLGTSTSNAGTLAWTSGNIAGSFKRWIAASTTAAIDFPVGTTSSNHLAKITFVNNTAGSLTARFETGDPGNHSGFPITDGSETLEQNNLYTEGSWSLVPTTLTSTNYALELSGTGFTSAGTPDATVRILKRADIGGPWIADGSHVAGTPPVAKRTGLSGFSRFILARPGQLPKISGNLNYYNTTNTPLNSGITVKLYQNGSQVGSDFSVTNGTYQFLNLQPGTYEIRASSSLTTAGSVNTSDAAQVNYWAVNPYAVEKVRFYSGDVTGSDHYVNSTDALRIQSHFVNGTAFDRDPWTFWRVGETISTNDNPAASYPSVAVTGSNVTADIYGLCTGDFNRSFVPGALRNRNDIQVLNSNEILASPGDVVNLPVTLTGNYLVGAFSLIFNYPGELAKVVDVKMETDEGSLSWAVNNNELRISWFSAYPIYINPEKQLLNIEILTSGVFLSGKKISFNLADNDLNELADDFFERINDVVIEIPEVYSTMEGVDDQEVLMGFKLNCYPNPAKEFTLLSYALPYSGIVTLELINSLGQIISCITNEPQLPGIQEYKLNTSTLISGIYIVKITLQTLTAPIQKTTKLVIEN